jgi:hypothetical protein
MLPSEAAFAEVLVAHPRPTIPALGFDWDGQFLTGVCIRGGFPVDHHATILAWSGGRNPACTAVPQAGCLIMVARS